jgi:signal transduction histidine kinase
MEGISEVNYSFFQIITEGLPTPVLLLDTEYNYIYCNIPFLTYSGLGFIETSGKGWSACLHGLEIESLFQLLSDIKDSGMVSLNKSLRIFKGNESDFFTTITVSPVNDQTLGWIYLLTFNVPQIHESAFDWVVPIPRVKEINLSDGVYENRDVVSRNIEEISLENNPSLSNIQVQETIADLKASNHLKDKILAIISHDLRSPIASLKGLCGGLFDEELSAEEKGPVRESLLEQLETVSDLTENLLRWASLSFSKKGPEETEDIDISGIVEQNISLVHLHSQSKNIEINNDIPFGLKTRANKDHMVIVLRNLISNSIKYTPFNGRIDISGVDLKTHVQIRVADTGIGLSSEQLSKLFTYTHSNTYGTNGEKGIGLGLILCKEYVESNGGKIFISSELNAGTTVILELPCIETEA